MLFLVDAFDFYINQKTDYGNEEQEENLYPMLHNFTQNELDLYTATYDRNSSSINRTKSSLNNSINDTERDNFDKETEGENLKDIAMHLQLNIASHNTETTKMGTWNGFPCHILANIKGPWSWNLNRVAYNNLDLYFSNDVIESYEKFMDCLRKGENPKDSLRNKDIETLLNYCEGDPLKASDLYLHRIINESKTEGQKNAIKVISEAMLSYYSNQTEPLKPPTVTLIGCPGSGKSWIMNSMRKWIDLRIGKANHFTIQKQNKSINQEEYDTIISSLLRDSQKSYDNYGLGNTVTLAYSGAAAGIVKGFTIHSALGIPVDLNRKIRNVEEPLPELQPKQRDKLYKLWINVKALIIDEAFTLSCEWLSLIDERLRQILNINTPFGSLPVILSGDPRQIVPVHGKPLYDLLKYFELRNGKLVFNDLGCKALPLREQKGYNLYLSSEYHVCLKESVRLERSELSNINRRISTYTATVKDVETLNTYVKPKNELYSPPWIATPWLLPTWKDVNNHIKLVSEYMFKHRFTYRAWAYVSVEKSPSREAARKAIELFYSQIPEITAEYKGPLPYIDFFPGQIVGLKENYSPTRYLFSNAKAHVVGITFSKDNWDSIPILSKSEAVQLCLENPYKLRYKPFIKPFIPFEGPSAFDNYPNILITPWTKKRKRIYGCHLSIEGPKIYPANAITHHQSQGATFDRCVVAINSNAKQYGMSNVVTSRTSKAERLALTSKVNLQMLQPSPNVSYNVERGYNRIQNSIQKTSDR